jgi:hypothetical protein
MNKQKKKEVLREIAKPTLELVMSILLSSNKWNKIIRLNTSSIRKFEKQIIK